MIDQEESQLKPRLGSFSLVTWIPKMIEALH